MNRDFLGWQRVAEELRDVVIEQSNDASSKRRLNEGQCASLHAIADRIATNGLVIADEVGMGKTRIAVALAKSVVKRGGRVAILVPPGLGFQWKSELRDGGVEDVQPILRSLGQYLAAWKSPADSEQQSKQKPWFDEDVVLISHAFTNWRLGGLSESWRWSLLPEVFARWRQSVSGRFPRKYHENPKLTREGHYRSNEQPNYEWVQRAAKSIVDAIGAKPRHPALGWISALEETPWPSACEPKEYSSDERLRPLLETAVGLGLGVFDLVIVDEAHKSRGTDSGLSRLLKHVVLANPSKHRRVAITATPVELGADQWHSTLGRVKVDAQGLADIIEEYADAVGRVRQCPSNAEARQAFAEAARKFQTALSPYVLRRDKREITYVQEFAKIAKEPAHGYRREVEIAVDAAKLTNTSWKQAICAAEALSLVASGADDLVAKRLRLTLGSGHAIAKLLDKVFESDEDEESQIASEVLQENAPETPMLNAKDKRQQRAEWWMQVMRRPVDESAAPLFEHPAILAAIDVIEDTCSRDEKVLVFGRFTRPLKALVDLLNAREMLRCLDSGRAWSQTKVHETESESDWPAVLAAHTQLGRAGVLDRRQLDAQLDAQYKLLEASRKNFRDGLVDKISEGLREMPADSRAAAFFAAFKQSVELAQLTNNDGPLVPLARAMQESSGNELEAITPGVAARAFIALTEASADQDEGDTDGNGQVDENEISALWQTLEQRLNDEYNRPQGGFARLMNGPTMPSTRRFLQLAFNRSKSYPKVLVAQSTVGREGLNLHEACRVVVLLHPEWNPAFVEQQIGRVDRVGSLWESLMKQAIDKALLPDQLPRILVHPVIFKGTYDEHNWKVLHERWDDLRAQLHGVVIPTRLAKNSGIRDAIVDEINGAAPNFSPTRKRANDL